MEVDVSVSTSKAEYIVRVFELDEVVWEKGVSFRDGARFWCLSSDREIAVWPSSAKPPGSSTLQARDHEDDERVGSWYGELFVDRGAFEPSGARVDLIRRDDMKMIASTRS